MEDPHVEVKIKPQLKPRGSAAKEEDPKLSHQLYKLQIKSTRSTKQTLCLEYIKPLRAPTKENALVLLWTLEARTHRTRLESDLPPQQIQRSAQC